MTIAEFRAKFTTLEWDLFIGCVDNQNIYFFRPWHLVMIEQQYADHDSYFSIMDACLQNAVLTQARYDTLMLDQPIVGADMTVSRATIQ